MSDPSKPPSLLRNSAAQSAPLLVSYVLSFVSAPIVLSGLGIRQFGIWALTGGLAQYAALVDLGAGTSVSRFIATNEGDRRACGEYMAIGFLSVLAVASVLLLAAVAGAGSLAHTIHGITTVHMRTVLVSGAVVATSSLLSAIVAAYPVGLRRMVAPNVGLLIGAVFSFIGSVVAIAFDAGIAGYAIANAVAGALTALIVTGIVLRVERSIPLSWPGRSRAADFSRYSAKAQLVRWADLVNYQTDKVVIALAVGPSAAGAYELANRVALAARQVGVYPLSALLPTLASDMASNGIEMVRSRYRWLVRITVSVGFPPLLLGAAIAPLMLQAWLAHVPSTATIVLAGLEIAYLANVSSGVSYVVSAAAGEPGIAARMAAATALLNVVLTAALAPPFGVWGVLAGTTVALTAGALAQVVVVHRRFRLSLRAYREAVMPTLVVGAALAIPVAVISYADVGQGRAMKAALAAALTVAYGAAYLMWALRSGRVPRAVSNRFGRVAPSATF